MKALLAGAAFALAAASVTASALAADLEICAEGAYPPFSELTPAGELVGFDIDIANALCAEIGVSCEISPTDWDGIIPALLEDKCDAIIASMSITEERKKIIDFTRKYYSTPAKFIGAAASGLTDTAEGLKGKTVGVQRGTVTHDLMSGEFPGVSLKLYGTIEDAYLDLESGRIDAVFADSVTLDDGFLGTDAGAGYAFFGRDYSDEKYLGEGIGIAVRKSDKTLTYALSAAITAIRANGTYDALAGKYFAFDIYGE